MTGPAALLPLACLATAAFTAAHAARCSNAQGQRMRLLPAGTEASGTVRWVGAAERWTHRRSIRCVLIGVVVSGATVPAGPLGAVVAGAGLAAVALAGWGRRLGAGRRYDSAVGATMQALARRLRGGASIEGALREVGAEAGGELGADLEQVRHALDGGAGFEDAVRSWHLRRPRASVRMVGAALCLGHRSGGLGARHVEELAASLRQADDAQREAAAQAGQAQASAVVMVAAPVAFGVLLAAGDVAARRFLLDHPLGVACTALGLGLDLGAAALMIRMVAGRP